MSATTLDFDVAVIGGGSGGYAAAHSTAAAGLRTVVIDGAKELGGLCILRGCMPTKALLVAAEMHHTAHRGALWGLRPGAPGFDWKAVMARKDAVIREFADYRRAQLTDGTFALLRSQARFTGPTTVSLSDGSTLTARDFVIATGSVVAPLPPVLSALNRRDFLTSDDILALDTLPKSIAILGGGATAVEFAQLLARFGVEVSLIQRSPHLLKSFDSDAAAVVEDVFRREGIRVFTGTRLLGARRETGGRMAVSFEHDEGTVEVCAEALLHALGRVPNTANLGLESAGVALAPDGRILANGRMETSAPHIFTAGDCTGPHEIVHLAVLQGEAAGHNIVHPDRPRSLDDRLLTTVVFTDPQVAFTGLTAHEAEARGIPFLEASYPFGDHGKSILMEARDGFVKLLAAPGSGELLGGAVAGPAGGDLIHEVTVALAARMTARQFAAVPHYHPTLAEIWTYPAEELANRIDAA